MISGNCVGPLPSQFQLALIGACQIVYNQVDDYFEPVRPSNHIASKKPAKNLSCCHWFQFSDPQHARELSQFFK
jgi:hypothetical protein